jgi:hypothetical protein
MATLFPNNNTIINCWYNLRHNYHITGCPSVPSYMDVLISPSVADAIESHARHDMAALIVPAAAPAKRALSLSSSFSSRPTPLFPVVCTSPLRTSLMLPGSLW